jgi:hypothetical protein
VLKNRRPLRCQIEFQRGNKEIYSNLISNDKPQFDLEGTEEDFHGAFAIYPTGLMRMRRTSDTNISSMKKLHNKLGEGRGFK